MENDHFRSFPTILNRIEPYDSLKQFGVSYKEKRAQVGFTTISDPDLQIRSDAGRTDRSLLDLISRNTTRSMGRVKMHRKTM